MIPHRIARQRETLTKRRELVKRAPIKGVRRQPTLRKESDLRQYQKRAVDFLQIRRYAALLIDMGLGKTAITLSAIVKLLRQRKIENILLVCPIRVMYGVWRQEARLWEHTRWLKFSLVHGTPKQRIEALQQPAHVHLINPEGLIWLREYFGRYDWPWDMLVVDESSMFKKPTVKRFRALRRGLRFFKRRVIMTGTPTPGGLLELWSQFFIVDRGYSLGKVYGDYRSEYFHNAGYMGYAYEPKPGAITDITKLIGSRVVSLNADDHIKLPPMIDNPVWVDMPDDARKLYERMEKEMFLAFDEGEVEIVHAASLQNRCSQIASGALWLRAADDPDQKIWRLIHDAKMDALDELISELQGAPPIVAYQFGHDLDRLKAKFPSWPVLGRGTSAKATVKIERDWNAGRLGGLIVHPRSAGHGLNLQYGGCDLIWFSPTWSLEQYQQLCKRLHRSGQTMCVRNHLLLARNTTDEAILAAIEHKDLGQRAVKACLHEYYENNYERYFRNAPKAAAPPTRVLTRQPDGVYA